MYFPWYSKYTAFKIPSIFCRSLSLLLFPLLCPFLLGFFRLLPIIRAKFRFTILKLRFIHHTFHFSQNYRNRKPHGTLCGIEHQVSSLSTADPDRMLVYRHLHLPVISAMQYIITAVIFYGYFMITWLKRIEMRYIVTEVSSRWVLHDSQLKRIWTVSVMRYIMIAVAFLGLLHDSSRETNQNNYS
jgi:hypothetical protein